MWFLYFGRKLGMSKSEIMLTDIGEMLDMLSCQMVVENGAELETSDNFFDLINIR